MKAFTILKLGPILWSRFNIWSTALTFTLRLKSFHTVSMVLHLGSTCISAHAQSARFFSTDNKLSSALINNVFEVDRGLICVATEDGLNRLDIEKVEKFIHLPEESTSVLHNYERLTYPL